MARPSAAVILQQDFPDGRRWEILEAQASYVICYKGQPINIRVRDIMRSDNALKYKKLTYTNLGNALRQVRVLNRRFGCEDFTLIQVGV